MTKGRGGPDGRRRGRKRKRKGKRKGGAPAQDGTDRNRSQSESEEEAARERPTPVRDSMQDAPDASAVSEEAPCREFEHEGEPWTVRVEGRTRSGRARDAGAPLLHLRFYRGPDPTEPESHTLVAGESLDAFYDRELSDLLSRARPWGPPEPFHKDEDEGGRPPRGR